jgi:hypothetical protein
MPHPTSARLPAALALLGLALLLGPATAAAQDDEGLDDEDFGPIAPKAPVKKGGKDPKKEGGAPAPAIASVVNSARPAGLARKKFFNTSRGR